FAACVPVFGAVFLGSDILRAWIGDQVADAAGPTMALLAVGSLFNIAVSTCYSVITAAGDPYLPLKVNLAGLALYLPTLYILLRSLGIVGAGETWILINAFYLFTLLPAVHRKALQTSAWRSLQSNFWPFVFMAAAIFGGFWVILHLTGVHETISRLMAAFVAGSIYIVVASLSLDGSIRADVVRALMGRAAESPSVRAGEIDVS